VAEGGIKVLVADSSETYVMYLSILLNRMGIDKIVPAESGIETLKLLKLFTPNVIILSTDVSEMEGITTLRHIREKKETSHIPVILVSSVFDNQLQEECLKLNGASYIVKPVNVYVLHTGLQECITYGGGKKRRHLRATVNKKVVLKLNGDIQERYALSMSEGGLYIRMMDPLDIGTGIEIILTLKNDRTVIVNGTVIYHHKTLFGDEFRLPPGMAIEFKDVSITDSMLLREYLSEVLARDIVEEQEYTVITI
jgi:CheY-like chemotaxis protein